LVGIEGENGGHDRGSFNYNGEMKMHLMDVVQRMDANQSASHLRVKHYTCLHV
jgi:hypothetical protein